MVSDFETSSPLMSNTLPTVLGQPAFLSLLFLLLLLHPKQVIGFFLLKEET